MCVCVPDVEAQEDVHCADPGHQLVGDVIVVGLLADFLNVTLFFFLSLFLNTNVEK